MPSCQTARNSRPRSASCTGTSIAEPAARSAATDVRPRSAGPSPARTAARTAASAASSASGSAAVTPGAAAVSAASAAGRDPVPGRRVSRGVASSSVAPTPGPPAQWCPGATTRTSASVATVAACSLSSGPGVSTTPTAASPSRTAVAGSSVSSSEIRPPGPSRSSTSQRGSRQSATPDPAARTTGSVPSGAGRSTASAASRSRAVSSSGPAHSASSTPRAVSRPDRPRRVRSRTGPPTCCSSVRSRDDAACTDSPCSCAAAASPPVRATVTTRASAVRSGTRTGAVDIRSSLGADAAADRHGRRSHTPNRPRR
ncbi:conserved hypothetical glycine-rich protein [Pseudonocardia sp. Ae168_Ps1]|nr:conserved hypothetical glycine-rich protein [Pseudonocardia sp. Ae150A_Ps1]OLL77792.1 conserved hypothetical glycine-rich protein [Pseudonocardia sp. Ae168_Ps1]OLL88084.1 conserved hypothetical glycine-rich protein [Pseudonocardia sp. Ae263_Ps1]OLL91890.1 conserved hypothetical glycine-rich protein [Pseudonocardia sp. Ae356_Ps1]